MPPTTSKSPNGTSEMTNSKKPGSPWWRPIVNGIDRKQLEDAETRVEILMKRAGEVQPEPFRSNKA